MTTSSAPKLGGWTAGDGAHFAVYAPHAQRIELDLGNRIVPMERRGDIWSAFVPGVVRHAAYLYRVDGARLLDPYAMSVVEREGVFWGLVSTVSAQAHVRPKPADRVVYEAHVRGMTMLDAKVPQELRGTFRGMMQPHVLAHLKQLGVTALELMPVFHVAHEPRLRALGLRNYWGYSLASFFGIEPRYASDPSDPAEELRTLIRALHAHDIEVILDVVYNHTGELDTRTFSWRGLAPYYRTDSLHNASGCGNVLDFSLPHGRALVLESLRYVHMDLGADGVRFDLGAIVLEFPDFVAQVRAALPDLSLFAEPWDASRYVLGRLERGVFEWNDRFRDDVRKFFRGDAGLRGDLASRYAGSSDLIAKAGESRSLNYLAAHDGLTLWDSVCYSERHNAENGEDNRDGHAHEVSFNHGFEGASAALEQIRLAHVRALLAVLYLSKGIPMVSHGDECARSQQGNNNAYCHDSELTWLAPSDGPLVSWCTHLARLRKALGVSRLAFYSGVDEVIWTDETGTELTPETWPQGSVLVAQHPEYAVLFVGAAPARVRVPERYVRLLAHSGDGRTQGSVRGFVEMPARSVAVVATAAAAAAVP